MEKLKLCPFCEGEIDIVFKSFGDHKDPYGQGSRIKGFVVCRSKDCLNKAFEVLRYYEHGYAYNSELHQKYKDEIKQIIATKWNTRDDGWIKVGDRLPEHNQEVIVFAVNAYCYCRKFKTEEGFGSNGIEGFHNVGSTRIMPTGSATLWQPITLPEGYQ